MDAPSGLGRDITQKKVRRAAFSLLTKYGAPYKLILGFTDKPNRKQDRDQDMRPMTTAEVRDVLAKKCQPTQKAWSEEHGLSESYVSDVLRGKVEPGPGILEALGLRRVVLYERRRHA